MDETDKVAGGKKCPECAYIMHHESGKKESRFTYEQRERQWCGSCGYSETEIRSRCNICGKLKKNCQKRIIRDNSRTNFAIFICSSCWEEGEKRVKAMRRKPVPTRSDHSEESGKMEECAGCGLMKKIKHATMGGERVCHPCYTYAIYHADFFRGEYCPIHAETALIRLCGRRGYRFCPVCRLNGYLRPWKKRLFHERRKE